MSLLLRLFVAVLAVLALLTARHLHRHQQAISMGLVTPPAPPTQGKRRTTKLLQNTRQVARPTAASPSQLLFLRLL